MARQTVNLDRLEEQETYLDGFLERAAYAIIKELQRRSYNKREMAIDAGNDAWADVFNRRYEKLTEAAKAIVNIPQNTSSRVDKLTNAS